MQVLEKVHMFLSGKTMQCLKGLGCNMGLKMEPEDYIFVFVPRFSKVFIIDLLTSDIVHCNMPA